MNEIQNLIYYGWLFRVPIGTVMKELAKINAGVSQLTVLEIWLDYDRKGDPHASACSVVASACHAA